MCLGIPGQIIKIIDPDRALALAEISGVRREVNYAPLGAEEPRSLIGSWALIHVGFAMSAIDEEEAAKTLEALAELGEVEEELAAMKQSSEVLGA